MKWFAPISCLVLSLFLLGCPGGSGSGGGTTGTAPANATPAVVVSGSVQAPNGQIASIHTPNVFARIRELWTATAYAALTGLAPVPNGTVVQIGRLGADGTTFSPLASTTTTNGQYSFDLTALGLTYAHDLIIVVSNGATRLRAFVVSPTVDIDPISETAVRLVLEQFTMVPGTTLDHFTLQEVSDVSGAVMAIALATPLTVGTTIEQTVATIHTATQGNAGLVAYLTAAAATGQTTQGAGDVGNYYPLTVGNLWQYAGIQTITGQAPDTYTNTRTITGTTVIQGNTTFVSNESNPLNEGTASNEYLGKTATGLTNWGNSDPNDALAPQLVPFLELHFPVLMGSTTQAFNKTGLNFGQDVDGDGKNETVDATGQIHVVGPESVTVQAGTFTAIRVDTTITFIVTVSSVGVKVTGTETQTVWLAANVGVVKLSDVVHFDTQTTTTTEELTGSVVDGHGTGNGALETRKLSVDTNDLVFDPAANTFYASRPGNPGDVAAIDPTTGTIVKTIPVGSGASTTGSGPTQLALSDDGHYLYVALNAESAIQRINLQTFTADIKFSLGADVLQPQCTLQVSDMQVLPGNGKALAVIKMTQSPQGVSCGENFYETAIYDDGVQRPTTVRYLSPMEFNGVVISMQRLAFLTGNATKLYGFETASTQEGFFEMTVSSTGLAVTQANRLTSPYFQSLIEADATRVYLSEGYVVDPSILAITGQFQNLPRPNNYLMRPDAASSRMFLMPLSPPDASAIPLYAYDLNTLQLIGSTSITGSTATQLFNTGGLLRWGANGIAFTTTNKELFLIRTSLVP